MDDEQAVSPPPPPGPNPLNSPIFEDSKGAVNGEDFAWLKHLYCPEEDGGHNNLH